MIPPLAVAVDNPARHGESKGARASTVKALQALDQDRWSIGRDIIGASKDPLASKLYYWMMFTKEKKGYDYVHLAQFIRNNPEWPGIKGMRALAEKAMPSNLTNQEIIAWFNDYEPVSAAGMDRYVGALMTQGKNTQAQGILAKWWASTLMGREEQKHIYSKYGRLITRDAHMRRLDMLLFAEQYMNARAIAGVLGHGYPALTEARIAVAEAKPNIKTLIISVPEGLQNDPGLLFERLRWRRKKNLDVEAMQILHQMPPISKIQNPEDWWQERHIIIRRLIEKKMYDSAYLLAKDHGQLEGVPYADAEWIAGWLALRFMNNPSQALQHFEALYKKVGTPVSKARGAYWAGRAAEKMKSPELAQKWYKDAAQYQTVFYGQLAGAELGLAQALPHAAPPEITAQDKANFNAREMIQAAKLFDAAGMKKESSRFLQAYVESQKTAKAYRMAAEMAAAMGRYHDAVKISKEATKEGLFLTAQSYPVITDKLGKVGIEWALVHAMIRQESMFDQQAQSPAGAMGLMQLMPGTAKEVARKLGLSYNPALLTRKPDYNIALGSTYMSGLLTRYGGSYPLAIAAYNAGPGRVNQWIETYGDPRSGKIDLIDWIEMLPVYETRNYVQRVLEGAYVYRLRLKNIQKPPKQPLHIAMIYK